MEGQIARAASALASVLPGTRVYDRALLEPILVKGPFPSDAVLDALIRLNILRKQVTNQCDETGFLADDDWQVETSENETLIRYEAIGRLMKLIDDLKTITGATPYFISFNSGEGRIEATELHEALKLAGISGFFSDQLQTGAPWKVKIISAMRQAGTAFLIESPTYHTDDHPRCQVQRDFLIARGKRIVRVGICDRNELVACPQWIDGNLNHTNFSQSGTFDLNHGLLGTNLPSTPSLEIRKRAGMSLIENVSRAKLDELATKLGLADQLSGAPLKRKGQLCEATFSAATQADKFCAEIDLSAMF